MTMKTIIWPINSGKERKAMREAVDRWRADRGMTSVIVLEKKRVGFDAAGKFYKAPPQGDLTFLRFPKGNDAVMFKLGYVNVDTYLQGDV